MTVSNLTLSITYVPIGQLKTNKRNARTHSKKQIAQIAASMTTFGNVNPILVDENFVIIAGHGRYEALKQLGYETLPVIVLEHLSEQQKRALMLADNKIAENAGWDLEILKQQLIELSVPDLSFEVSTTGFETAEIDNIIDPLGDPKPDPIDVVDAIDRTRPSVTRPGDLWQLGDHRLLCGDALDVGSYAVLLLPGERADQVVTDPPYNVKVNGHVGGLGKTRHAEFAEASGEMRPAEFTGFLTTALTRLGGVCKNGAIVMSFMDWRHCGEILAAGEASGLAYQNLCVWDKINGGMGSLYRSRHELVFIFKAGTAPHTNNIQLGKTGRYRTNVWRYAGASMFRKGRKRDLETHPTVKPIAMIMDAIKDCSRRNEVILDAFGGSGTTLLAAERTGRKARLIELDPYYVDATIRRWQKMTGKIAVHVTTGVPFAEPSPSAAPVEEAVS